MIQYQSDYIALGLGMLIGMTGIIYITISTIENIAKREKLLWYRNNNSRGKQ